MTRVLIQDKQQGIQTVSTTNNTQKKNTTQQKPKLVANNITEKELSVTDRLYWPSPFEF
jgi:hypothetical protein